MLGHSAACPRALRLAMDAPERVRAMVLVWPVGLEEGTNTLGTFYQVFNETMRVARAEGMTAVVEAALNPTTPELRQIAGPFASVIRAEPAFREELRAMSVEAYITRIIRYRDGMWPEGHEFFSVPDSWPAAATLPTLILPGDDALHPAAVALRLCRLMPHARCLPPGWVQPEARAATARAVRETIG